MDSAAALALATEPPNPSVLNHPPHGRTERLITEPMGRHILAQAAYQVFWLLLLLYAWPTLLGPAAGEARALSLLFNAFIWCQIFNEINCRRIQDEYDIFAGLASNRARHLRGPRLLAAARITAAACLHRFCIQLLMLVLSYPPHSGHGFFITEAPSVSSRRPPHPRLPQIFLVVLAGTVAAQAIIINFLGGIFRARVFARACAAQRCSRRGRCRRTAAAPAVSRALSSIKSGRCCSQVTRRSCRYLARTGESA